MTAAPPRPTTREAGVPGAFEGETVTRRRFMTGGANAAAFIAGGAIVLPAAGFAVGPIFHRAPATWLDVGRLGEFSHATYVPRVITIAGGIGDAGKTTIFVRRRDPAVDMEPGDRLQRFSPRDSGESLDGIGKYLYPPRFTTARAPKGA